MTTRAAAATGDRAAEARTPLLPGTGESTLADLSRSVLASLGVPGEDNALGLPPAEPGLPAGGRRPRLGPAARAPARRAVPVRAGRDRLLADGRLPGDDGDQPGLARHRPAARPARPARLPGAGAGDWPAAERAALGQARSTRVAWQPGSTIFERAAAAGVARVPDRARAPSGRSGLSSAVMRGADYRPADTLGALVGARRHALAEEPRGAGDGLHRRPRRDRARLRLHVGGLAVPARARGPAGRAAGRRAAGRAPPLHVTADHGMVDVPPADRIDADAMPELRDGVALLGGEPRARHVYAAAGRRRRTCSRPGGTRWVTGLGGQPGGGHRRGLVRPVRADLADRIGDVVAASAGPVAVVATTAEPRESALVGMHGSLAPDRPAGPAADSRGRRIARLFIHSRAGERTAPVIHRNREVIHTT